MIEQNLVYRVDLDKPISTTFMNTLFATQNSEAHKIDIQLFRGNTPVILPTGATVSGKMLRRADPEKRTVNIPGSASGNVASITLNRTAYAMSGAFSLNIDVTIGDVTGTVFHGEGSMITGSTDTVEDDEKIIYNVSDLLAQINAMETATAAANTAAGTANTAAGAANQAATNAQNVADTVQEKLDNGEFIGPAGKDGKDGEKGDTGEKGDKGDTGSIENLTAEHVAAAAGGILGPNAKVGNPLVLRDQWAGWPMGVKVTVEPVQEGEGDPSPTNVRSIHLPENLVLQRCKKNLFDPKEGNRNDEIATSYFGVTYRNILRGTVTMSISLRPGKSIPADYNFSLIYIKSNGGNSGIINDMSRWFVYDGKIQAPIVTFDADVYNSDAYRYWGAVVYPGNATVWDAMMDALDVQIEYGDQATAYEPYVGDTYSVPLPADFGGGVVDVTGGTIEQTGRFFTIDEDNVWYEAGLIDGVENCYKFYCGISGATPMTSSGCQASSHFLYSVNEDIPNSFFVAQNNNLIVRVQIEGVDSAEKLKAWLANQSISFWYKHKQSTPDEITPAHIPALPGENILTTNGTSVEVSQRQGVPDLNEMLLRRIAALETYHATN